MHIEVDFVSVPNYSGLRWLVHPPARPRHWLITDDSLQVVDSGGETTWQWSVVAYVRVRRNEFMFRQRSGLAIDVPRAALSADQEAELQAFLAQHRIPVT